MFSYFTSILFQIEVIYQRAKKIEKFKNSHRPERSIDPRVGDFGGWRKAMKPIAFWTSSLPFFK